MSDAGVRLGLGVDGSASNDGNHLLGEARQAMLLQRVGWPGFESSAERFSAREALALATRGGAEVLGRDDIGSLEVGKAGDLAAYRVDGIQHAGAAGDRVAALLTCAPVSAWLSLINGKIVIEQGEIVGLDLDSLVQQHNQQAQRLLRQAAAKGNYHD
jgi:cytosine/adenosine deaminase-related metal-dependent hydrolase